jgi:uncharacterized membrane protein YhaH (DUF805 family)
MVTGTVAGSGYVRGSSPRLVRRWEDAAVSMDTPPPTPPPPPPSSYGPSGGASQPVKNPLIDYWKKVVLENYANFRGRARRAEFWWFTLANVLVVIALIVLTAIAKIFFVLYIIYGLALILPSLGVAVRRLHDTDKSAWFLLLYLIPFAGGIIMIVLFALDSTRGTNRYGTSEKYPV